MTQPLQITPVTEGADAYRYRGWHIARGRWPEPAWTAVSPNYDASYEGPEDGWVDNGEKADGSTREELLLEIDRWFAENGQFGVGS